MKKTKRSSFFKRVLCFAMILVMLFSFLPISAFADEISNATENEEENAGNEGGGEQDATEGGAEADKDDGIDEVIDYSNAVAVHSADELEAAISEGVFAIRIAADFELDRTFYITSDAIIVSDEAHTLTRASDFGGDIFVIGEKNDGTPTEKPVTFTVGKPDENTPSLITIDGNAQNMTVDVVGTVFFVREGSRVDLYNNLTVTNNIKVGNEKTLVTEYKLSYPIRIGGAVAIVSYKASMRIFGGSYTYNSVNDITEDSDAGSISSQGGVIYNYGVLDIYGGSFANNHAGRGGAFYNYRTMNIYNAVIDANSASTLGGAIYVPNSTAAYLYIGEENDIVESSVIFSDNTAASNGGAIYAQHVVAIKNAEFNSNITASGNGGAISAGGMELGIEKTVFKSNSAASGYGGAIYLSGSNDDEEIRELIADSVEFTDNSSKRGGAMYISGGARAYFSSSEFSSNVGTERGGAFYLTGANLELNGADIKYNSSGSTGGAVAMYTSSTAIMNKVTADSNSSSSGGFVYVTESFLDIYNSTVSSNTSTGNGGAIYAYTNAVFNAYNTIYRRNVGGTGGAVMIYNGGTSSLLHSCVFEENSAPGGSGGAIYISNKSKVDIYNTKATDNSAAKGGFMYETTSGTVVKLAGLTLSGNTATEGGPIIWGNTTNAKLYIDKIKYVDNDYNGDWNDEYWNGAIYNLLTVYDQVMTIPSYVDYSGVTVEPPVADSIINVSTAAQLERALQVGYTLIRITSDFELDRTFFVTSSATIFAEEAHTLKRAADFGGDIFVIGEGADGDRPKTQTVLSLSKIDGSDSALSIDGNFENMTVDVVGTVLLVCTGARVDLGKNLTVFGHKKVGNDRINNGYTVSYAPRVGGAVAIIENKAYMDIYGGTYTNNSTNDITADTDEGSLSSYGGAFYNYGTLKIYGGTFSNNHAGRGGAFYNYRTMHIYNATISNNTASTYGGAIYTPNSTSAFLYTGGENDVIEDGKIYFNNNSAELGGGAIYARNLLVIKNAVFEGNKTTAGNGAALHAGSTRMTLQDSEFKGNISSKYGGVIYLTGSNELEEVREMTVVNCIFVQNNATSRAGAIYMSGSSRAYFENTDFKENTSGYGGVFYLNGASIEINGANISDNVATSYGGFAAAYASSDILINNVVACRNKGTNGGVIYISEATASIYNSEFSENEAKSGGVAYAAASSAINIYGSVFSENKITENGGALMIYTGGTQSVIHSCTFIGNMADGVGGALYISNKSLVDMYNIIAKNNSASKGGFMYETTSGTVVDLVGITVSGNTATDGGAIIWGNTANAKLNIDKSKYTDLDATGALDSAYWSKAIYNKLTVKEVNEDIPKYLDYGNEAYDNMADAVDVADASELEAAILSGVKHIRIVSDFEIDRTFYITGDVTIFTTIEHTIKRAADFYGDIFVIGEDENGNSSLLMGMNAKLTLGNPVSEKENLLVIDGNRDNMTVDVDGCVLFVAHSSIVDLHKNLTVKNCYKIKNDRTYDEKYLLPIENRIGGSVAIVQSGTLNIYGGYYSNNSVSEEINSTEEGRISSVGGVIFNTGTLNVYGGTFENNVGARGAVIYNYRVARIFAASFIGNEATVSGGVYYAPNSAQVHLYIGSEDGSYGSALFKNNSAKNSGGVIYASTLTANVIYGNASFVGNSTKSGSGGAICMYGQLTVRDSEFEGNTSVNRGGAIYASNSSLESVTRFVEITGCTFEANEATLGGAISLYAGAADYPEGAIANIKDCKFILNKASLEVGGASSANGGAIFADRKVALTVLNSEFDSNEAATEAGAIYLAGESVATVTDSVIKNNKAGKYGGAIAVRSSYLTLSGTDVLSNIAASNGGAIYVSYQSNREINSKVDIIDSFFELNESTGSGGAIYATRRSINDEWDILTVKNTEIKANKADKNGGALATMSGVSVYIENVKFIENIAITDENGQGGAIYATGSIFEINGADFKSNEAKKYGGAIVLDSSATAVVNNITTTGQNSSYQGGFAYVTEGSALNIYNSDISNNTSENNAGAVYVLSEGVLNAYNTVFANNASGENGGALMIYTGGTQSVIHSCTFIGNAADGVGGALYISNKSLVDMYNIIAKNNSAPKGGFMYETTSGTVVDLVGITVSGNTATDGGAIIWGNTANAKLNIDKSKYTDLDATGALDSAYWSKAIYNKLTVNEISEQISSYEDYKEREDEPSEQKPEKTPVSVDEIFSLAENSSDGYINTLFESLPKLDSSSNFMSDSTTYFENINGETVTVDSFVYQAYASDGICSVGEGILIYQAMLYKQAHPEEDVSISISSYRFSIEAAINVNRNSRYFGYMRNLVGKEYDEFGFVRISYLLVSAAKMGINVTVIGQLDAYPIDSRDPGYFDYFTDHLNTPCDPEYSTGKVGDYMNFANSYWTLEGKGGTDMMHTKLCAVSHYIDMNGVEHKNAVWTSSSNLDGISSKGYNGNWKLQTATIVSDHEYIYRVSANYLSLIAEYSAQEAIYEFQDIMSREGARQIDLILAGRANEIPEDEQLVYLGTENDTVFELYFTPFAGSTLAWDENYNPYCKYLREMYNSEDSIIFIWNAAEYNSAFPLGQQMEDIIVGSFLKNPNVENKFYGMMEFFDPTKLDGLVEGENIGYISLNEFAKDSVHNKDILLSYVKDGQRYYVSLLNSCNMHSGSMCYQSNFMLVIKETNCEEDSVFFNMADLSTEGIVEHTYGEETVYVPDDGGHGYYYIPCLYCDKEIRTGIIHCPGEWIIDRTASVELNGIEHRECTVCHSVIEMREVSLSEDEKENTDMNKAGVSFTSNDKIETDVKKTPLTIEALIKLPKTYSERGGVIVSNYDGVGADLISLEIFTFGKVRLYTRNGGIMSECYFDTDIRSDAPVHIAVTVNGKEAKLYVNGELADTRRLMINMPSISDSLTIGGDNRLFNTQYFKGEIYSVALFDDVRTINEIRKDMVFVESECEGLLYSRSFVTEHNGKEISDSGIEFDESSSIAIDKLTKTPYTIEAIVNLSKGYSGRGGVIFGNYDGSTNNQINFEIYDNGVPRLYINRSGVTETIYFNADIRSDALVHIAIVFSGKTVMLYVDGEIADFAEMKAELPNVTSGLKVGGDNRVGNLQYFKGKIYALGLYGTSRSADEIKRDSIRMSSDENSIIYLNYFANQKTDELLSPTIVTSKNPIEVGNLADVPYTIEATIRLLPGNYDRAGVIVGNYDAGTDPQINLEIYYNGIVRLFYNNGITKGECLFTKIDIRSNSKTHIAVAVEGKTAKLYVDGVLVQSCAMSIELPDATENFKVGGDNRVGNTQYFKGELYSVYMFNETRTAEEIVSDMNAIDVNDTSLIYAGDFTNQDSKFDGTVNYRPEGHTFDGTRLNIVGAIDKSPYTFETLIALPEKFEGRGGVIFGNYIGDSRDQINFEIYDGGRVRLFYVNYGVRVDTVFNTDVRTGEPVHIALSVDGTIATLYINGEIAETVVLPLELPTCTETYVIGGDRRLNNTQYFKGVIYNIAVFGDVRSTEEIKSDKIFIAEDTEDLVCYASYGMTLCDPESSDISHIESGWIIDRPATEQMNGLKHKEISNAYKDVYHVDLSENSGLSFESESDAIGMDVLASAPKTFEALIQLDNDYYERAGVILGSYDGGNGDGVNIEIYTNGNPRLYYKVGGIGYSHVFTTDIRSSAFVHIAIVVDGLNVKLYVDGKFAEEAELKTELPTVTEGFNIGNDRRPASGQYFKGRIFGITLFDDVRDAEEIATDALIVSKGSEGILFSKYYESKKKS